jgi:hypothetical protein
MKQRFARGRSILMLAAIFVQVPAVAAGDSSLRYPPQAAPFQQPMREWTADWWQFIISIPTSINPITDEVGTRCMYGQRGPVWFIAGNLGGTASPTTRSCAIPEGKVIFFPVLNLVDVNVPQLSGVDQTANDLRAETGPCLDNATQLVVELDGQSIENLDKSRVRSVVFELTLPDGNLFGIDPGSYSPAIDDGYYVMLKPLGVGQHQIHILGASSGCPLLGTSFSSEVTYNVSVVPVDLN